MFDDPINQHTVNPTMNQHAANSSMSDRAVNPTINQHAVHPTMSEQEVNQAITPLRLIFWGGLLCVFDFNLAQTINGPGLTFDVLSDFVGAILITLGVYRLRGLRVNDRYASVMTFVLIASAFAIVDALQAHFVPPLFPLDYLAFDLVGVVNLGAIVTFCVAMRWFCEHANLRKAARSWSTTTVLFVFIYLVPLGLYHLRSLVSLNGTSFNVDLGSLALLILPIFALPLIHLFISTSRMKRAAETWLPWNEFDDIGIS